MELETPTDHGFAFEPVMLKSAFKVFDSEDTIDKVWSLAVKILSVKFEV